MAISLHQGGSASGLSATGSSPKIAKFCSTDTVSVNRLSCPHARARGGAIPVSSDADRPARAGWAALRLLADVASSF